MDQPGAFNPTLLLKATVPEREFVASLARYQASLGMIDREFADLLSVKRILWNHTRIGRLRLGFKLLRAAAGIVPQRLYTAAEESVMDRAANRPGRQPKKVAA